MMTDCEVLSETDTEIERLVTFKREGSAPGGKVKEKVVLKKPMKVRLPPPGIKTAAIRKRERSPMFSAETVVDTFCRRISINKAAP